MKLKVGNKTLTIRKWKGKDKKALMALLKKKNPSEMEIMEALVYTCIEEDVILSAHEMKYVLTRIRILSFGDNFEIALVCDKCENESMYDFKISDVIRHTFIDRNVLTSGEYNIRIGEIKNKNVYLNKVKEDETFDLLLRVESFNGNESFTLDELEQMFDEMDIDILEDVYAQWESSRFKIDDLVDVECLHCHEKQTYRFDAIPNFFPETWKK